MIPYTAFILGFFLSLRAVVVVIRLVVTRRARRRAFYEKENELIRRQAQMVRFKRYMRSVQYVGPETLQPKWHTFN